MPAATDDTRVNVREPPTTKAPAETTSEASDGGLRRKRRRSDARRRETCRRKANACLPARTTSTWLWNASDASDGEDSMTER